MAATLESISKNLNELERRYAELDHLMADPAVATNPDRLMAQGMPEDPVLVPVEDLAERLTVTGESLGPQRRFVHGAHTRSVRHSAEGRTSGRSRR